MYKILVRNREKDTISDLRTSKYSIYYEDDQEFSTMNLIEALDKINELLDKFLRKDIILIDTINVYTKVTTDNIKIVEITPSMIIVNNNKTKFTFKVDLSSLNDYTIVDVNKDIFDTIKTQLEALGFTNIKLTDTFEITADNETGNGITGSFLCDSGLFTLYSRKTGTSGYLTSNMSANIEYTEPVEEQRYIDIYFVDEDNNPLVIDKVTLFLRANKDEDIVNKEFDYKFENTSEVHMIVKNSGNYIIEVEKENYNSDPYYEKEFTGKSKDEDALTIKLTKNIINEMLDEINGENI